MSKSLPDGMTDEEAWFATKWNRIERRLFCRITQNWNGRLLTDRLIALPSSNVELIGATTTRPRRT